MPSHILSDMSSDVLSDIQAVFRLTWRTLWIVSVKATFCLAYLPGFFLAGLSPVASVLTLFLTVGLTLFLAYVLIFFLTIFLGCPDVFFGAASDIIFDIFLSSFLTFF